METVLNISNVKKSHKKGKNGTYNFNCWGATLYALSINKKLKWTNRDEMIKFLVNCTEKIESNLLIEGDILTLWREDILKHTAVYIGNNCFFHKRGSGQSEYATKERIKTIYNETDYAEIRRIQTRN